MSARTGAAVDRLFEGVEAQLAAAVGALAVGEACDLDGLAERMDALCGEALLVAPAERALVRARLGRILQALAWLERGISDRPAA